MHFPDSEVLEGIEQLLDLAHSLGRNGIEQAWLALVDGVPGQGQLTLNDENVEACQMSN